MHWLLTFNIDRLQIRYAQTEVGEHIPYAGRVFTEDEVEAAVSSTLDFWLTLDLKEKHFKKNFNFLGVRHSSCQLGSSANLLQSLH